MVGGERRRKGLGTRAAQAPESDQIRFPRLRRNVKARHSPWTAPVQKQQTITQMDPFFSIFHPELINSDLSSGEDALEHSEMPMHSNKRRKIEGNPNPVTKALKRSKQAKNIEDKSSRPQEDALEDFSYHSLDKKPAEVARIDKFDSRLLKTPVSKEKKIIPSSQSPPDSPLSVEQRRNRSVLPRSPLKEKSGNTPVRRVSWAYKREIANSMSDAEDEDERPLFDLRSELKPIKTLQRFIFPMSGDSVARLAMVKSNTSPSKIQSMETGSSMDKPRPSSIPKFFKQEVGPSQETEEDDDDDEGEWVISDHGAERPVPVATLRYQVDDNPGLGDAEEPPLDKQIQTEDTELNAYNLQDSEPHAQSCRARQVSGDLPTFCRSDSDLLSAQLHNELRYCTQAYGPRLETDSQYENAWQMLPPQSSMSVPSSSAKQPLSPGQVLTSVTSTASSFPTQPVSIEAPQSMLFSQKPQLSPSQATTVDTIQASPYRRPPSPSQPESRSSTPPPRRPLAPSSSPLPDLEHTRDGEADEWNADPLGDSQLLPESLRNDSLGRQAEGWGLWGIDEL